MQNISPEEQKVLDAILSEGSAIKVVAHCPQKGGGCHPFEFTRGVLPGESEEEAFARTSPDVLQHIEGECGKSCTCENGKPNISYKKYH